MDRFPAWLTERTASHDEIGICDACGREIYGHESFYSCHDEMVHDDSVCLADWARQNMQLQDADE